MKPHKKDSIPGNVTVAYRPGEERKQQAKARVLEIAQEMSSTFATSGLSEDEVRTLIEQEVEEVRSQKQSY